MGRRRWVAVVLLVAGFLGVGGAAWAYWAATADGGGAGAASAGSVSAGVTPTGAVSGTRAVTVSWPAATLSTGRAVDGYVVRRYDAVSATLQTVGGGCGGTLTVTTCTETAVPVGSWRYSVTPVFGAAWTGAESPVSTTVAVPSGSGVLTLTSSVFRGPFPVSATGALSGFAAGEAVSYRLGAATALTGTPTSVGASGSATVTALSIPAVADGIHTISALGGSGSQAMTTITVDTTAPSVAATLSPAATGSGWNTSTPVQVTLTGSDGTGTGVAQIRYTTDGTDPLVSGTAATYLSPFPLTTTQTVRFAATDVAGNTSAVSTQQVLIDAVAPVNSLALSTVSGSALQSGATVYYRGAAAGSFTLTNTVTDAGSGPASSGTAALSGPSTGWAHTSSSVSAPSGGPFVSNPFTWSAGATSSPSVTVTGSDVAGNTTGTVLSFVDDSTAPTGGSVDVTGLTGRYSTTTSLAVAFAKGADAGSGLKATGALLQRAGAPLAAGSCGSFASATFTTIATDPAGSSYTDGVADNACYRYRYVVTDNLGNSATYSSGDVLVDTSPPAAPGLAYSAMTNTYASGSTVHFRSTAAGGSFTVTATAADTVSGIAAYAFPSVGAGWTATAGGPGVMTYSWSAASPATVAGARNVTVSNNAGSVSPATAFILTADTTGPTGGSVDATGLTGRYSTTTSLSVGFAKGADAGSGVKVTGASLKRAATTLASGSCGPVGTFTTVAADPPGSSYTDGVTDNACYRYQYEVSDNVGNTSTFTSPDVLVDTSAPAAPGLAYSAMTNTYASGTTVYVRSTATSGAFTVTATAVDTVAGIASYTFPTSLGTGWTTTTGGAGVRTYSWSAAAPAITGGARTVTATNNAGLASAATSFTLVADTTAPAVGTPAYTNGSVTTGSQTVSFTQTDGGSGVDVASGLLQRAYIPNNNTTTCDTVTYSYSSYVTIATGASSPYTDANLPAGYCYKYQYVGLDNVGNTTTAVGTSVTVVTGVNLALTKSVVASSTTTNGVYPASNATDGNAFSYWEGASAPSPFATQTLTVDLGATRTVARVIVKIPTNFGGTSRDQTVAVLGSADNTNWTTLKSAAAYNFSAATFNFANVSFGPTSVRYVRLAFTTNNGTFAGVVQNYGGQVSEFEVYAQ